MLPTGILVSLVISPSLSGRSWVFMVGGVLSMNAHFFFIAQVGRDFSAIQNFRLAGACLPRVIDGLAAVIPLVL